LFFTNFKGNDRYVFVLTATEFTGELIDSREGTLEWIPDEKITGLNLCRVITPSCRGSKRGNSFLQSLNMMEMRCADIM
jgi:hypothetical protein